MFIVPGVDFLMIIIMNVETSRYFGRFDYRETLKMIFLPHLGLIQMAYGDAMYYGPTDWSDDKHREQRKLSDHVALFFSLPFVSHAIVYGLKLIGSKDKPKTKSLVKEWSDAILFAIIAAAIIRRFFFEPFTIPTPSMEKDLLVGDYLFVSKLSYGPQWPNTPLSIPFFHNRIPFIETNSYVKWIQRPSYRLPGFGNVERNDIVVFNFPAGDTAINDPGVDGLMGHTYKQWQADLAFDMWLSQNGGSRADYRKFEAEKHAYMKKAQTFYEDQFGLISRPVDKRENYIKRCVGIPGDEIEVYNRKLVVNNDTAEIFEDLQYNYLVNIKVPANVDQLLRQNQSSPNYHLISTQIIQQELGPLFKDSYEITPSHIQCLGQYGDTATAPSGTVWIVMPMTSDVLKKMETSEIVGPKGIKSMSNARNHYRPKENGDGTYRYGQRHVEKLGRTITQYFPIYPNHPDKDWTEDNFGPLKIPAKGWKIELNKENWILYKRCISVYEGHAISEKDGKYIIDGKEETHYTFEQDYYWMMGDNRQNSADSRFWGFVPEDHIVGKAMFIWMSIDEDGIFGGGIRWDRIFTGID